ncbi:hypothetical protein [Noviherbaspirillum galbum]|uniref:Uncharacterized protein n=1 Tax=Noviherbaspirillum galbum TaxID=2709383 RepID=A0A6B3SHI9_9BURK|nr:hypothetical protein [Noviherbaspirillum galbum]NEX60123.1 hypothetical protein [Noviherbaspirillum galbum]
MIEKIPDSHANPIRSAVLIENAGLGIALPCKLVDGNQVPMTSAEVFALADSLRIAGHRLHDQEQLARIVPGTVFFHRMYQLHVVAVQNSTGIYFRHCDRDGAIRSEREICCRPLDVLVPVREPEPA